MQNIHKKLIGNIVTSDAKNYFKNLIEKYQEIDAAVLALSGI